MMDLLPLCEVEHKLAHLNGWELENHATAIHKSFQFSDFDKAFAFMTACAEQAKVLNHHPTWKNTYNVVHVHLSTHDVGGLTERDFILAQAMERMYKV